MWIEAKTANLQEANRIKAVFFQYIRRIRGKKMKEKYDDKREREERKMYFVT